MENWIQSGIYKTDSTRIEPKCDPQELFQNFIRIAQRIPGGYEINKQNEQILYKLCMYFSNSPELDQSILRKGIMLVGNAGSGKTTIMRIFSQIVPFSMLYVDSICDNVRKEGQEAIDRLYSRPHDEFCYDDLGSEQKIKFYGSQMDVMHDVIIKRCRNLVMHGTRTHFTTNMSMGEISKLYDLRVESRLNEMCNVLVLGGNKEYKDFRKQTS